jgi:hypothetical protein
VSDWGQESEALFRSARRGLSPSQGDRERVRARIAAKLGAAAVGVGVAGAMATATSKAAGAAGAGAGASAGAGAGAAAGVGAAASKGLTFALVAKIVAPLVIAGATVAVAPRVMSHAVPTSAPVAENANANANASANAKANASANASANANASADAVPAVSVDSLPAVVPPPSIVIRPNAAPGPSNGASLSADEALLVGEIDTALRGGDAATALKLAADHERRFPRGVLGQERDGARVVARCMSGAKSASGADAFLAAHPRSPMRARIIAACEK